VSDTNQNMDTSPDSEADTASGGAAEPRDDDHRDVSTAATDEAATDDDGTPVENPAG
jgi:hypothetical protein